MQNKLITKQPRTLTLFIILFGFMIQFPLVLIGQNLADMQDPIYTDIVRWQGAGFMEPLPYLQPLPTQVLVGALERMLEHTNLPQSERTRAEGYYQRLAENQDSLLVTVHAGHRRALGDNQEHFTMIAPRLDISWEITDWIHLAVLGGPNLIYDARGEALAKFQREPNDWVPDWSDFDVLGRNVNIRTAVLSHMSLGNQEFGGFLGFGRTNYGPFFDDGIVLSGESPFGAYFGYTWHRPELGFSFLYRPLTATDNRGAGKAPDKHLVFHSLEYRPTRWLTLSFYEAMIWGERFELSYFVPFSGFFLTQGLGGFEGNSLIGLTAEITPLAGLRFPFTIYADDVHFNDVIRFELDTKYKLAFQLGALWFPQAQNIPVLERLGLDYTAVMPYMYTHWDEVSQDGTNDWLITPNFSNYTHRGQNLGPGLEPNSDRLRLMVDTRPLDWLTVQLLVQQVRHGNASEGTTIPEPTNTGTIFDPGYDGGQATFQETTRFLTQNTLEITRQIGLQIGADLPVQLIHQSFPRTMVRAGYTFEHIQNPGFQAGTSKQNHLFAVFLQTWF